MITIKPNLIHKKLDSIKNSKEITNKQPQILLKTESSYRNTFLDIDLFK